MTQNRIDIITMGCSKNLIDSERIVKRLAAKGYVVYHDAEYPSGEYVIVNTCGFIGDAKEESINLILGLTELKKKKKIGRIMVMGCLSERYRQVLPDEIPEVDLWYGKYDWRAFIDSLEDRKPDVCRPRDWERQLTTPPWSAYLKVSEGCDRMCAYCAIPLITGRHRSRPIEEILEEATKLASEGVKELNVIAQDLSSYGIDLYDRHMLPELIDRLAETKGIEWIRLHYLYPTDFPIGILEVMNRRDNVCKYIDLALQHISDKVLGPMNRKTSKAETLQLLRTIHEKVPGIHIRTTVMTGFPGEDEGAYKELEEMVKTEKFERLGGFAYSEEDDTLAARTLDDNIPTEVKEQRLSRIMEIQQEISSELNRTKIGSRMKVLIEEIQGNEAVGRTEYDSPEVDQEVIVSLEGIEMKPVPGDFLEVEIVDAGPFDLRGIILKKK